MSASLWQLAAICKDCVLFSSSGLFLAYGILVFIASLVPFAEPQLQSTNGAVRSAPRRLPMVGELGEITDPRPSTGALVIQLVLKIVSFRFFKYLVVSVLDFIRTVFLMRDNPSFRKSFLRYFLFYFVIIPLPAAFMPPVVDVQRKPDFQLMCAVVLLIIINALGDAISVRVTLRKFEQLKFEKTTIENSIAENFWAAARNEISYYFAVVRGALYSLLILTGVLALSSVLYGVQVGQLDFAFSWKFVVGALDRVWQTPSLAFDFYWFRNEPGPFGLPGIPGLFLYGLTTFLPMIVLFLLGVAWLALLPFRIAVNLPGPVPLRLISSELAVIAVCIAAEEILKINLLHFYFFLMHAWTT
jgi:hypothetical protein